MTETMRLATTEAVAGRFVSAYILLGALAGVLLTALTVSASRPAVHVRPTGLLPITNGMGPAEVDRHFSGKALAKFSGSSQGVDGTCWGYSNKSSWTAVLCLGGINVG